jgi:hypothetical protein
MFLCCTKKEEKIETRKRAENDLFQMQDDEY